MELQEKKLREFFEREQEMFDSWNGDFKGFSSNVRNQWRLYHQEEFTTLAAFIDDLTSDEQGKENASSDQATEDKQHQIILSAEQISQKPTIKSCGETQTVDDDMAEYYQEQSESNENGQIIKCKLPGTRNLKETLGNYCTPKKCEKFLDCQSSYINWYARIPFFIIDNLMSKRNLSHSAFVIFLYLCRKANFDPRSNHFSRCWVNMKEISEVTGIKVSNMRKYVKELETKGMVKCTITIKRDDTGYKTSHEFTVYHVKMLHDKREEAKTAKK